MLNVPCVRAACLVLAVLFAALLPTAGCASNMGPHNAMSGDMAAFIQLVTPRKIQIQRYLTKPVSLDGAGDPDGIEVILQALDSLDDPVKCIGMFHFELRTHRFNEGDRIGTRVGFWRVEIGSDETVREYWDRLARYYRFPLSLREGPLPPGQYVLSATLMFPTGDKLFDEYTFTHESGAAPARQ